MHREKTRNKEWTGREGLIKKKRDGDVVSETGKAGRTRWEGGTKEGGRDTIYAGM